MNVQHAKDCPGCETAAKVSKQDEWPMRVLDALRIDDLWFHVGVFIAWWIFLLTRVKFETEGVSAWLLVIYWIVITVVTAIAAVASSFITLIIFAIPSWVRRYLIGWPMTMETIDGVLHRHLGHESKTGCALFTRHYGPWRKTTIIGPRNWRVVREARGYITLSNVLRRREVRWLLTVNRGTAAELVCRFDSPHNLPVMALSGKRSEDLLQKLGLKLAEHHQAVAEDKAGLGFTPRGQAMRAWLRDLVFWAHGEAGNLSAPLRNLTGNPLSPAVTRIIEQESKIKARRRKKHKRSTAEATS